MNALEQLAQLERRGRAMRRFTDTVRERGGVAIVEETIDLPRLRAQWRALRRRTVTITRLDKLGPTPVDSRRVDALRRQIAAREGGPRA